MVRRSGPDRWPCLDDGAVALDDPRQRQDRRPRQSFRHERPGRAIPDHPAVDTAAPADGVADVCRVGVDDVIHLAFLFVVRAITRTRQVGVMHGHIRSSGD